MSGTCEDCVCANEDQMELAALREENARLQAENKRLRGDHIACHMDRDILASLYEAWDNLPACGLLAITGGAIQEIQALRSGEFTCRECAEKKSSDNFFKDGVAF